MNEPAANNNLFGLNLSLKFKLTQEFLTEFIFPLNLKAAFQLRTVNSTSAKELGANNFILATANQRNQSHRTTTVASKKYIQQQQQHLEAQLSQYQRQPTTNSYYHPDTQFSQRNQFAFKIQCKYKLTEVSDVTFNELVITQQSTQLQRDADPLLRKSSRSQRKLVTTEKRRKEELDKNFRFKRRSPNQDVKVAKSTTSHQVLQTKYPANHKSLLNYLFYSKQNNQDDQCKLGSLALFQDDPILLENSIIIGQQDSTMTTTKVVNDSLDDDDDNNNNRNRRNDDMDDNEQYGNYDDEDDDGDDIAQKHSIGDKISVNCSTISGLNDEQIMTTTKQQNKLAFCYEPQRRVSLASGSSGVVINRGDIVAANEQQQRFFSSSPSSSWLSSANNLQTTFSSSRDYIGTTNNDNNHHTRQRGFSASVAYLSLDGPILAANEETTTRGLELDALSQPITTTTTTADSSDTTTLLAPPLLEWFINNQEVSVYVFLV